MLGTLFLLLVVILLVLGIIFFFTPQSPTKNKKETEETSNWKYQKEQSRRESEATKNKEWFKTGRWLTDKEIDWATARLEKNDKFKILPAHQFHLAREAKRKDDPLIFKELLKEINDPGKELIFIPVNNPNFHWSLLVYETKSKTFYHYDTLGGANDNYVEPLVKELLEQIRVVRNIREDYLAKYLIKRHGIRQNNGSDCGVAVIAIIKRIRELSKQNWRDKLKYGQFRMGDDLGSFDFQQEREELREEYLKESKN